MDEDGLAMPTNMPRNVIKINKVWKERADLSEVLGHLTWDPAPFALSLQLILHHLSVSLAFPSPYLSLSLSTLSLPLSLA